MTKPAPPTGQIDKVSFSQLQTFEDCPHKHYLSYIKKLDERRDTIYTIFGNAVHDAISQNLVNGNKLSWITMVKKIYRWVLENPQPDRWIKQKPHWLTSKGFINPRQMGRAALRIYSQIFGWLTSEFGNFTLVGSEIRLETPIHELNNEVMFKGFIDFVLVDEKGVYHICDFKTTDVSWNKWKREDKIKQHQLALYKKFFSEISSVSLSNIKTHFVILKRMPDGDICEKYTIDFSGEDIENTTKWSLNIIGLINKGFHQKKRSSCNFCDFHHTEHCP